MQHARHSETIARKLSDVGELPAGEARRLLADEDGETLDPFDDDDDNWD